MHAKKVIPQLRAFICQNFVENYGMTAYEIHKRSKVVGKFRIRPVQEIGEFLQMALIDFINKFPRPFEQRY